MVLRIPQDKRECDMKELIPDNPNIVGRKKIRQKKDPKKRITRKGRNSSGAPDLLTYGGEVDPFKDSSCFVRYYRAFLRNLLAKKPRFYHDEKLKFASFESDVVYAGVILDLLYESQRKNKQFLDTWITDYFEHKLSGKKIRHIDKTSMRAFKESFVEFETRYLVSN